MTKKDYFNQLLNVAEVARNEELVKFIEREIELLNRKNSGTRKASADDVLREKITDKIMAEMENHPNKLYTATDMVKAVEPYFEELISNQRVSFILRNLTEKGFAVKTVEKRKSYFHLNQE